MPSLGIGQSEAMLTRSNGEQIGLTDGGIFYVYKNFWSFPLGVCQNRTRNFDSQLEFLHDPFGVAGQFHVALSMNWLLLCRAGCLDGAFPIGH